MVTPIKAYVFDVYGTLFDVHSVKEKCEELFPEKGESISLIWRKKQLEYFFMRQLMGDYEDFQKITKDALGYTLEEHHEEWSSHIEQTLISAYSHLTLYPEVVGVLKKLSKNKIAIFSNGTPDMLDSLITNAGLTPHFDRIISVDEIKQYKPTPASYRYALKQLGVAREEVLFISSNGWDISGAKNFGFQTAWINRAKLPEEKFNLSPDRIYSDLNGITEWND
ncbi:haloacid dehalogenase type II [Bacillus haimaensis]|uniref:haloacid dehalogenase type II n=1 Tax=Bacillus haimaensis TaxID=3160967 RepID=UPI003AA9067D